MCVCVCVVGVILEQRAARETDRWIYFVDQRIFSLSAARQHLDRMPRADKYENKILITGLFYTVL